MAKRRQNKPDPERNRHALTSSAPTWLRDHPQGAVIGLHVQPRASRTELGDTYGNRLRMRVAAAPVEGKANREICHALARLLTIPKNRVSILSGASSRDKQVLLEGVEWKDVLARLGGKGERGKDEG